VLGGGTVAAARLGGAVPSLAQGYERLSEILAGLHYVAFVLSVRSLFIMGRYAMYC
jgi:hypothetical protein